jgi:hypothetical protein
MKHGKAKTKQTTHEQTRAGAKRRDLIINPKAAKQMGLKILQ